MVVVGRPSSKPPIDHIEALYWGLGATAIDYFTFNFTVLLAPFLVLLFGGNVLDLGLMSLAAGFGSVCGSSFLRIILDFFGFYPALWCSTFASFAGLLIMGTSASVLQVAVSVVVLQTFDSTEVLMFTIMKKASSSATQFTDRMSKITSLRWSGRVISPIYAGLVARYNILLPALIGAGCTGTYLFVGMSRWFWQRCADPTVTPKPHLTASRTAIADSMISELDNGQLTHKVWIKSLWMIMYFCTCFASVMFGNIPTALVVALLWGFRPLEAGFLSGGQSILLLINGKIWSKLLAKKMVTFDGALLAGPTCLLVAFVMRWRIGSDPYAYNGFPLYFLSFAIGTAGVHAMFVVSNVIMLQDVPSNKIGTLTALKHSVREGINLPIPTLIFSVFVISPTTPYLLGAIMTCFPLMLALAWLYARDCGTKIIERVIGNELTIPKLMRNIIIAICLCVTVAGYCQTSTQRHVPIICGLLVLALVCTCFPWFNMYCSDRYR